MILEFESLGGEGVEISRAAMDFEDAAACPAGEVVVVCLARQFVVYGLAGQFHGREPAVVDTCLDGAVDGGESEARCEGLRQFEDFLGREGSSALFQGSADGTALWGVAFHLIIHSQL